MVSKLLLATSEVVAAANRGRADSTVVEGILSHFDHIQAGLGPHKPPAEYGAIPLDPYSHTTGFSGVQQPGLTGQVKEDLIARFAELGVCVEAGEVEFRPVILGKREFIEQPETWEYSLGGDDHCMTLEAGSLAFSLCGVPVVYRLADAAAIHIYSGSSEPELIPGSRLGKAWSASLFQRENRIQKLVIDLPQAELRH